MNVEGFVKRKIGMRGLNADLKVEDLYDGGAYKRSERLIIAVLTRS